MLSKMRIAQNITFNEGKENPKTLVIKLEDKVVNFYHEGMKIGSSCAGLMEKYLKDDVQDLQNKYHFDKIDVDPKIEMKYLFGLEF